MTRKNLTTTLLMCGTLISVKSQETDSTNFEHLTIESEVIMDNVANFNGGIKQDYTALGLFDFAVEYKPAQKGLLKNTTIFGHIQKSAGKGASKNFIGDVQVASNIEGSSPRLIYELSISQSVSDFNFTAGILDLNAEFMASEYAGDFINSSFGITPSVTLNTPVPIFPVTSFGGIVSYNKKHFDIVAGAYNLNHEYGEEEFFEFENHFFQKGFIGVGEIRYRLFINDDVSGEYRVGMYYKNCDAPLIENDNGDMVADSTFKNNDYGIYSTGDQKLATLGSGASIGAFGQLGFTPDKTNYAPEYYALGICVSDINKKFMPDYVGLAAGNVALTQEPGAMQRNFTGSETVIELTAKKEFYNRITIQPDLQYIISPSGTLDDALVGILRIGIALN